MFMYLRIFLNMYFCIFLNTHSFSPEICVLRNSVSLHNTRLFSFPPPFRTISCSPTTAKLGCADLAPIYFFPPLCFSIVVRASKC